MNDSAPKILIARSDMLGDLVTATALVPPLRQRFPDAKIYFLARPSAAELLLEIPDVDGVISDTQSYNDTVGSDAFKAVLEHVTAERFDIMINLWEHPRYAVLAKKAGIKRRIGHAIGVVNRLLNTHTVRLDYQEYHRHKVQMNLECLKPLGISAPESPMQLVISNATRYRVTEKYPFISVPYRVVAVDAGAKVKCFVDAELRPILTAMLEADTALIVLVGGAVANASDATLEFINHHPRIINLTGKTTLLEVAAIIQSARYFVGPDSGLSHVAAALQCPAVVIYRTRTQNLFHWAPWLSRHVVFKQQLFCKDACLPRSCPCPSRKLITPETVVGLIDVLNQTSPPSLDSQSRYWDRHGHQAAIFGDIDTFKRVARRLPTEWDVIHLDTGYSIRDLMQRMEIANTNLVMTSARGWPRFKLWVARTWVSNRIHFYPSVRSLFDVE